MKVLITGANGFVGKHLVHKLIDENIDVYPIDNNIMGGDVVNIDILKKDQLLSYFNDINPDVIIHLAAISNVDYNMHNHVYNVNLQGTINVLDTIIQLKIYPKLVYVSSSQVYGKGDSTRDSIDENHVLKPINHYGAAKASSEIVINTYINEFNLEAVIVRPFNHTGVGQSIKFVIPKIVRAFKLKSQYIELGNIDVYRDFTDVRDVVHAYYLTINKFQHSETFNICSSNGYSIKDIIDILKNISGHNISILENNSLKRQNEIPRIVGNNDKINRMLGWKPVYSLEETLHWMYEKTDV